MQNYPQYKCHKIVQGFKIGKIMSTNPAGAPVITKLISEDGEYFATVNQDWVHKHSPISGGYFVLYEDGYTSFRPCKAFEKGYTKIGENISMTFGAAVEALKSGHRITRIGWNGPNQYVYMEDEVHDAGGIQLNNNKVPILKTTQGKLLVGWVPTQNDMLAEDWQVIWRF